MTNLTTQLMPASSRLLAVHEHAMPQKDELCGAFWSSLAVSILTDRRVSQEEAAVAAGTSLSSAPDPESLPPGEDGRRDYSVKLPTTPDASLAGTSPRGIVESLYSLSEGSVTGLPIRGPWSEDSVLKLVAFACRQQHAVLVLNVSTAFLWGTHPHWSDVTRYLLGEQFVATPAEWDVGHFVGVVGTVAGPDRTLVMCADTYPSLGVGGVHLQPPGAIASALRRDGRTTLGGAILVIPTEVAPSTKEMIISAGFEVGIWGNGVPDPGAGCGDDLEN